MDLQYRDRLLAQNLVKLYRSGVRDFSNKKIWGNLTGEDLSNSNFSNCDFYADKLERANLSNTNFENANLYSVNLGHANLENANFKNVVIKSDFRNSFKGVNLCNANLSKVSFEGVDFTGASLQRAILQETVFWYVNLKNADLTEVNLEDSVFKCVYWLNTPIDNIEVLPEKELLSWQLVNQLIVDEDLTGIDLSEVNLETANLEGINLSGVNLTRARLSKINLANANLQDSNLHQACLLGANLKNTSLIDADLSVAHLAGADLSNANLRQAKLRQAKLNNAVLNDTNLENANLTSASVFHAKLHKAINVPSNIISTYKPLSIDNPNKELIKAMKEASKGLYHPSKASEPYEVFLWEQKHFGNFTLDGLLELTANLKLVDLNDFENSISAINMNIPNPQIMIEEANQLGNAFKSIIKSISSCLTNVDFYQFETIATNDYSRCLILL